MTDSDSKETLTFKMFLQTGEELTSTTDYSGEATLFYSNGDKYSGELEKGVI